VQADSAPDAPAPAIHVYHLKIPPGVYFPPAENKIEHPAQLRRYFMKRVSLVFVIAIAMLGSTGLVLQSQTGGLYKVLKTAKVGGLGGFDYVYADSDGRRLYIPRTGQPPTGRITVYNLDTLEPAGEIPNANARGAAVDPKSGHGFASSKPVVMWDTKTLAVIKTIDVQGGPDGILFDPYLSRVWVFSHSAPNATIINAADGTVVSTLDLGGAPEQAVTDGNGHMYVDLEDKDQIAVVDTKTLTVTAHWPLEGKGGGPGGLGFDVKNHILFASCHDPATMVILNSDTGKIITALPIGQGTDGATFNPATMEAFSSNRDATLTVIKENSPTDFVVEQNLTTMTVAKTLSLDAKTNRILLIAAELQPAPPPPPDAPPPPAGRGGRGPRMMMVPDSFTILSVGK
jgi:DNA-binding beta-propeller fold protein YncE